MRNPLHFSTAPEYDSAMTLRQHMQERHPATPLTRKNSDLERLHARLHREALDHSHDPEPPAKQRFYFSFGVGYNLGNNYVVVEAETAAEARAKFRSARAPVDGQDGRLYAFDYDSAEFLPQIKEYGLTEVPIDAPIRPIR